MHASHADSVCVKCFYYMRHVLLLHALLAHFWHLILLRQFKLPIILDKVLLRMSGVWPSARQLLKAHEAVSRILTDIMSYDALACVGAIYLVTC